MVKVVPALCFQVVAVVATGYQHTAFFGFGNSAYYREGGIFGQLGFVLGLYGKQQFVIFATVKGTGNRVQVKFKGYVVRVFSQLFCVPAALGGAPRNY